MMMHKTIIFGLASVLLTLTACMLPVKEDPFERLPTENLETITGKLFPFSVSVATRATHRLEKEGKLVGYLASDLVQLAEFEGQEVLLEGVWRNEKMRQIFWVESIKVATLPRLEDTDAPQRFSTKKFTMLVPPRWEYSLAPNGVVYFLNKEDPARRVFLTFAVDSYSPEAGKIQPNIDLNGFAGTKETQTDTNGKEREIYTLYSNLENKKYIFTATYFFDDFDTKKMVFDLLLSFVEGETAVQETVIAEQKAKAEAERQRLATAEAESAVALALETDVKAVEITLDDKVSAVDKARELLSDLLSSNQDKAQIEDPISAEVNSADVVLAENTAATVVANSDYTNLIDDRAFNYESSSLGLNFKVPYGYWYRSFGALLGTLGTFGVSDTPVNSADDVKLWIKVLLKDNPAEGTTELITGSGVTLIKKRNDESVIELTGSLEFRDVLWSIADSITP